jgi:hypothetical protein
LPDFESVTMSPRSDAAHKDNPFRGCSHDSPQGPVSLYDFEARSVWVCARRWLRGISSGIGDSLREYSGIESNRILRRQRLCPNGSLRFASTQ